MFECFRHTAAFTGLQVISFRFSL